MTTGTAAMLALMLARSEEGTKYLQPGGIAFNLTALLCTGALAKLTRKSSAGLGVVEVRGVLKFVYLLGYCRNPFLVAVTEGVYRDTGREVYIFLAAIIVNE